MRPSSNVETRPRSAGEGRSDGAGSTANGTHAAVVLGARNLGAAIARDLLDRGLRVATIARTRSDLDLLERDGAIAFQADAADPEQLRRTLSEAAAQIGPLDLIVNAVSAITPPGDGAGFGGGPLLSASMAGFEGWTVPPARQAFVALKIGSSALQRRGGTIVQVVGAPARRANPGRGLMAAGGAAVRALTHAAAQELRADGIHVALLIVDGMIASPKTARMTSGMAPEALVRQEDVIRAVTFLAAQSTRGMTHELVITAAGDRWLP
jgi:NAD(P)-dependent dehydrogenase (short-subunit alcohol dehydrogenase family)